MTPDVARDVLRKIGITKAAEITGVPQEILEFFMVYGVIPRDDWEAVHFNLDRLAERLHGNKRKKTKRESIRTKRRKAGA